MTEQYVVCVGNPFDGMALYGPFPDAEAATDWAERGGDDEIRIGGQDWHTVPIMAAADDEQERADEALGERNAIVPPAAADRAEPRS